MSSPDRKSTPVFVSYSHRDKKWLQRLQVHLKPLVRAGDIELWDDTRIQPGADGKAQIDRALATARVAVLLVSADFLASDFVQDQELPVLLEAAERRGTRILPVILSHSLFTDSPLRQGWRIQYPLDGELRVPEPTEHERIAIRLLPLGSKKWWSDDRIEKFIADTAARAKEQIAAEKERQVPDFGRYIKEWALQYGFSAEEARAEIERWVAEVQRKQDDFYKLGLAAFAEKNFGKAERLFRESAAVNERRMRESERRIEEEKQRFEDYREATIRDYRLAGDAAYNDYAFTKALDAYRAALHFTDRDQRPRQWAEVTMDIANANVQIGIRTEGPVVQQYLAQAVAAYRAALQVYTRELLPQQWATTQNNLGAALGEQGTRTGGEEGRRLLAQAVDAFRGALGIYQAAGAGHYVQIIECNIALTELFLSAESDPDAQSTLRDHPRA